MAADELVVLNNRVTKARFGEIGGKSCAPASAQRAAWVQLALSPAEGPRRSEVLGEGDTFAFGTETWKVHQIDFRDAASWAVVLHRVQ
jgi:hypothetical protein